MNISVLIGNITKDLELRKTGAGISYVKFSLATNESYVKDGETIKDVQYHNIVFWSRQAEVLAQYCHKGSKIAIVGKATYNTYEKDGVKRYSTEIRGQRFELLDKKDQEAKVRTNNAVSQLKQDSDEVPF